MITDSDRRQNSDDDDYDNQLNQGKPLPFSSNPDGTFAIYLTFELFSYFS